MQNFIYTIEDERFLKGRTMVDLPFNVWEVFGCRGVVVVKANINGIWYEFSLVPRGKGNYAFTLTSLMKKELKLKVGDVVNISMEVFKQDDNPMVDVEKSYRKIESVNYIAQPTALMCGQACVAMLAGAGVYEVAKVMGIAGSTSIGQIMGALDHYNIRHSGKNTRISKKNPTYSKTCILTVHMPNYSHWVLHHEGKFYDPEFGVLDQCHPEGRITSFLKIMV